MGRTVRATLAVIAAVAVAAVLLAGCAPKSPAYVENGKDYDRSAAITLLASVDTGHLADQPTTDGPKLRHAALAALRRHGATASKVADLLTKTFPSDTAGVPLYVERGSFDAKPAVVVVEATGPTSGRLSSKRIWFVGEKGDILFAGSR